MPDLIVIACHGPNWIEQCQESLQRHAPEVAKVYIDTAPVKSNMANVSVPGVWPTGCLLWAYEYMESFDNFLLIQDSTTVINSPLPWFRSQWEGSGAVAWQRFPMDWDNPDQCRMVENRYTSRPSHGIVGPIFYTDRPSLNILLDANLLPTIPTNRLESCATERSWSYAFNQANMPVTGPIWDHVLSTTKGVGPLRKTWANRL